MSMVCSACNSPFERNTPLDITTLEYDDIMILFEGVRGANNNNINFVYITILGMMGWDGVIAGREAGAKLWSVRLFGVSRRPGGRRKPLESLAGFNFQRGRRRLAAAGPGRPSLILQQHKQYFYT